MSPIRKNLIAGSALVGVAVVALIFAAPSLQRSFFYPKPQGMPSVVEQPVEQLLASLKAVLEDTAPAVARALQPGLTDDEIARLESEGGFRLSDDLRALYLWHNGMPATSIEGLLPGHRFVPLDEVVRERFLLKQQIESASAVQQAAFAALVGHQESWVHVLNDGAGDGYFYDPDRSETEGPFFYHMAEVGYYVWFPSLSNFLSGIIECYESGAITPGTDSGGLEEDYDQTDRIWRRFGRSN